MSECRDLKGSAVRSIVLGFRLVGATVRDREAIAEEVLNSEKVQKAIHEAFRKQAGLLIKASLSGQSLDAKAAKGLVEPIGKAAQPQVVNEVKKQKAYQDAALSLKTLKCSFDRTPVGVFIDKNTTWLIIAGVVLGAGSAAAMYLTRSGDVPAKGLAEITNLAAKKIEVGAITFGVKGVEFVPSEQAVKGNVSVGMGSLETVKARFELSAAVKGGALEAFSLSEAVIVPLSDDTRLTAKAGVGLREQKPTYDMALAVRHARNGFTLDVTAYTKGAGSALTVGGKATAGYRVDSTRVLGPGSRTTIGATAGVEATRANANAPFQTTGMVNVGLTATFW